MLLDLLADDLVGGLRVQPDGVDRQVILWLDPERQFSRIVNHLESVLASKNARLLTLEPESGMGQVALKFSLLGVEDQTDCQAIVYLPGHGRASLDPRPNGELPVLWSVYEYRFKGTIWGADDHIEIGVVPEPPRLLDWLQEHGLQPANEKARRELSAGGADAPIARYAERQLQTNPADWPHPLRLSDVEAFLGGDARDVLKHLFASPSNAVKDWGEERRTVLANVTSRFGLTAKKSVEDPETLADQFALDLALTEAWDSFGRPDDFPFVTHLPRRGELRDRQVSFLRDEVLANLNLGPLFRQRIARLEPGYDLSAWAAGRSGQPGGLPLLARGRWRAFMDRLDQAATQGWKNARDTLLAERDSIASAASAGWTHLDADTHWPTARGLIDLVEQATAAANEAPDVGSIHGLVDAYVHRWWLVDRLHLEVRAVADSAGLNVMRLIADAAYFTYVERCADRFSALVEAKPEWPPTGLSGVEVLQEPLWHVEPRVRKAVIVTDACRWDLAAVLRERLSSFETTLTPVMGTLPSNTPFGMAALLPLRGARVVPDFGGGKANLRVEGGPNGTATLNLATRDGRKAFLQAALREPVTDKPTVDFMDLTPLLKGAKVPNVPILVVFDNDLDEQGHKGVEQLPRLATEFVAEWKRAIERLHEAGIGAVHLVTDHGFLLLPVEHVEALGQPKVRTEQALYRHTRWAAFKPDAPLTEVIKIPFPAAPKDVMLGIPRGVRSLVKPEPYMHGGLSLQECVLPHLVSRQALAQERVGVEVIVTTQTLSGGTVPVVLRPVMKAGQAPLGGVASVNVRLWVETVPSRADESAKVVSKSYEQHVALDDADHKPPLFLLEGLDLRAGQAMALRAVDAESGRELATVPLTLLRDWE